MVRNGLYPLCTMLRLPACGPEMLRYLILSNVGPNGTASGVTPGLVVWGRPLGPQGPRALGAPWGAGWPGLFASPLGLNSEAYLPQFLSQNEPNPRHTSAQGGLHLTVGGRLGLMSTTHNCNSLRWCSESVWLV